jgi:Flp pilus assembly protein TadD
LAQGGRSDPASLRQVLSEALEHQAGGRLDAAEALYRSVLAVQPNNADAMHLLGMVTNARGNGGAAVEMIRRAIAIKPHAAQFHNSLGTVLGAHGDAIGAASAFRQAISLKPDDAEAHRNLGLACQRQGRLEEAVISFRHSVHLRPGYLEALHDLAGALQTLGWRSESTEVQRELLEREGGPVESFVALGLEYRQLRRLDDSVAVLRRAVDLSANDAAAHFNLGLVLLEKGEFPEGFREYEWRWGLPDYAARRRKFSQPLWDGSELRGRTILLYTEQGLGTSVQFIRYAPLVAARGGKVIVQCPSRLTDLFKTVRGVCRVVSGSESLPHFDVHAPLVSLPMLFGTTLNTVPVSIPYMSVDPARLAAWENRIGAEVNVLKVGLVWQGSPKPDPARSCDLAEFAPLAGVDGVVFYSLQIGEGASQATRPPAAMRLVDLCKFQNDFADTAGAISRLDLVISVDTSVAHVAGALGKPVWTVLPYLSDWRWMVDRADTPWYPTMRLFRQTRQGEWGPVFDQVARELRALASVNQFRPGA